MVPFLTEIYHWPYNKYFCRNFLGKMKMFMFSFPFDYKVWFQYTSSKKYLFLSKFSSFRETYFKYSLFTKIIFGPIIYTQTRGLLSKNSKYNFMRNKINNHSSLFNVKFAVANHSTRPHHVFVSISKRNTCE